MDTRSHFLLSALKPLCTHSVPPTGPVSLEEVCVYEQVRTAPSAGGAVKIYMLTKLKYGQSLASPVA